MHTRAAQQETLSDQIWPEHGPKPGKHKHSFRGKLSRDPTTTATHAQSASELSPPGKTTPHDFGLLAARNRLELLCCMQIRSCCSACELHVNSLLEVGQTLRSGLRNQRTRAQQPKNTVFCSSRWLYRLCTSSAMHCAGSPSDFHCDDAVCASIGLRC
jgi:hypothetical protein